MSEWSASRCSLKIFLLKILQNFLFSISKESIFYNAISKETLAKFLFFWVLQHFWEHFFIDHLQVTAYKMRTDINVDSSQYFYN